MTNNDVLRRIRYTFDFNDSKVISIFALAELEVSREEISNWLKKDDDAEFVELTDEQLATFLNGLINEKRGKKEGPQPIPEKRLSKNFPRAAWPRRYRNHWKFWKSVPKRVAK